MKNAVIALLTTIAVLTAFAEDSYLYWMVDTSPVSGYEYDRVQVRAINNDDNSSSLLSIYWSNEGTPTLYSSDKYVTAQNVEDNNGAFGFYASLTGAMGDNYSYVIELFNDTQFLAQSEELAYVKASEFIATGGSGLQNLAKAWNPTSYAIPEPNSAILVLLGCAGLALRRRRLMHA